MIALQVMTVVTFWAFLGLLVLGLWKPASGAASDPYAHVTQSDDPQEKR